MTSPDRIWAYPSNVSGWTSANAHDRNIFGATEYVRADLIPATPLAAALAVPEVLALVEALRPFAGYLTEGMDKDSKGAPLQDGEGVGWVYLTHGDFRRASAALRGVEKP